MAELIDLGVYRARRRLLEGERKPTLQRPGRAERKLSAYEILRESWLEDLAVDAARCAGTKDR
jgi:hypothetical protein